MNLMDMTTIAFVSTPAIIKSLISRLPEASGNENKKESLIRRIVRAASRSWVRGGAMVDALNQSKFDARHHVYTAGATV